MAHFARAARLSPVDPEMFRVQAGTALVHLFAGRNDEAVAWAEKSLGSVPTLLVAAAVAAAGHALAGRRAEASAAAARIRGIDPMLRVSRLRDWLPIHREEDLSRLADGLRRAGLPD